MRSFVLLLLLVLVTSVGCAVHHRGVVYVDRNADGIRQADELGFAGAVVAADRTKAVVSTASGSYDIDSLADEALLWVRIPDGFRPGSLWVHSVAGQSFDLGLIPFSYSMAGIAPSFVVAADTHVQVGNDPLSAINVEDAITQAVSRVDKPLFFTILGDLTNGVSNDQTARVDAAIATTGVPFVAVPGNHDWYDGGAHWRNHYGPDNYSFDIGNFHFVVWDTNLGIPAQQKFLRLDASHVDPSMVIVALGHDSPKDEVAETLDELGANYLFTGHWHVNRVWQRGRLTEWGTQPLAMGGIDASPAGYRVVQLDGKLLHNMFWPTINAQAKVVNISAPSFSCVAPSTPFQIEASLMAEAGSYVAYRIDCGDPHVMSEVGPMSYAARDPGITEGEHTLHVEARLLTGRFVSSSRTITGCTAPSVPAVVPSDWPQLGGNGIHAGLQSKVIEPGLVEYWSTQLDGTISTSVIVQGTTALVALTDFGQGDQSAVVALDIQTGSRRWRHAARGVITSTVATENNVVIVATTNGWVEGLSLQSGASQWAVNVNEGVPTRVSSLWAAPTVYMGIAYVATPARLTAIRISDGATVFKVDNRYDDSTWLGSRASVLVGGDIAIATFSRDQGVVGFDRLTGQQRWRLTGLNSVAVNASPVATALGTVIINSLGQATMMDPVAGQPYWTKNVFGYGFDWGYSIMAAPTASGDTLLLPTLWGDLVALDLATQQQKWTYATKVSALNFAHYRGDFRGFPSAAVVTGVGSSAIAWVGELSGMLTALDVETGVVKWRGDLGAPLASSPTPAGDIMLVASFDGKVRALIHGESRPFGPVRDCIPSVSPLARTTDRVRNESTGCSTGATSPSSAALLCMFVIVAIRRKRCCR
jgi:hypothetical protein